MTSTSPAPPRYADAATASIISRWAGAPRTTIVSPRFSATDFVTASAYRSSSAGLRIWPCSTGQDASASSTDAATVKCLSSPDTSSARRVSGPGAARANAWRSAIRLRASTSTPSAVESTNSTSARSTTRRSGSSSQHASNASRTSWALYRSSSPARCTTTRPSARSTPATGSTRPPGLPSTWRIQSPSYAVCMEVAEVAARAAGENFPVGSVLFPRRLRPHVRALYCYARLVDELGDAYDGDRPAALDELSHQVDLLYAGT